MILKTLVFSAMLIAVSTDKCGLSATPGTSADGKTRVVPTVEWAFQWQAKNEKGEFETRHEGKLTKVGHPHLYTLVFNGGNFVIVNPNGGREIENRVVLYEPTGKVIRSLSLADFLTEKERGDLTPTMSHISWMKVNAKGDGYKMDVSEKEGSFSIELKWDRTVRFDGKTGEVLKEEPAGK